MYHGWNCRVIYRRELGCILLPSLFLLVLDLFMAKVNNSQQGIVWQHLSGTRLESLDFAYGICSFARVRTAVRQRETGANKSALDTTSANGKSKMIRLNLPGSFKPLRVDDDDIEEVEMISILWIHRCKSL